MAVGEQVAEPTPESRTNARRRVAFWAALAVALFVVTYPLTLGLPVRRIDEAWMLWVTRRLTRGDRLYEDVYFVTTPLAAWLAASIAGVLGVSLAMLRSVQTGILVAQVLLALTIARWCRLSTRALVLLGLVLMVTSVPLAAWGSIYTSLATLFLLVALRALLAWLGPAPGRAAVGNRTSPLVTVGVACALSFGAKPNIGMLGLAAALASMVVVFGRADFRRRSSEVLTVLAAFLGVCAVGAVVLLGSGSWDAFVSQVFADKGTYIDVGFSYTETLGRSLGLLIGKTYAGGDLERLHGLLVLIPFAVVSGVLWAFIRSRGRARREVTLFALFAFAALASAYPRPGYDHVAGIAPLAIVATLGAVSCARAGASTRRALPKAMWAIAATVACAGLFVTVQHALNGYSASHLTRSGFASFTGTPLPKALRARVDELSNAAGADRSMFIVTKDAGFWYLTAHLRDPLPFDIPERSDFAAGGQRGVIERLRRGEAPWVCIRDEREGGVGPLRPVHVERWVRRHYEPVVRTKVCTIYRRPT